MLRLRTLIAVLFPAMLTAQDHDVTLLGTGYLDLDVGQGNIGRGILATATAIYLCGTTYDEQGAMQLVVLARNTDGTAMTSFGTDGQLLIDASGGTWSNAMLKSSTDGTIKLIATRSGDEGQDVLVYGLTSAGTIDATFGSNGISTINLGGTDLLFDALLLADGRTAVLTFTPGVGAAVTLLTPNGSTAPGYGANGTVYLPNGVLAMSLAQASAGGLWLGGTQWTGSENDSWIGLLNGNGDFDNSFSGDGQASFDLDPHLFEGTSDIITTLAPHPAGGHLALVNIYGDAIGYGLYRLARSDDQGLLMPDFGTAGVIDVLTPDFVNLLPSMTLEPDGRSVLCVGANNALVLEKRDSSGQLFSAWGNNGISVLSVPGREQYSLSQAVVDPQGRFVAIGTARLDDEYSIAMDRVTNDLQNLVKPIERGTLGLMAFPVPFRTELSLRAEEPLRRVEVFDTEGRLVQNSAPNSALVSLDLRLLDAGTYTVQVHGDSGFTTRTVIKQ